MDGEIMKKKLKMRRAADPKEPVSFNDVTTATSKLRTEDGHVPNAETARVLREAEQGKNLVTYANLEEMFEDLGI